MGIRHKNVDFLLTFKEIISIITLRAYFFYSIKGKILIRRGYVNYCAIDFETGCNNNASSCAVGIARIEGGKITDTFYSLIKPPVEMPILPFFENIHGISNKMIQKKLHFNQIWPDIKNFIGDAVLIAHNARFDHAVLNSSLSYWKIADKIPRFECTLSLARKKWPFLNNHKLNSVCEFLGIELTHHDALSDAVACGLIWVQGG